MYKRETRKGCPEVILALDKQYNDLHEIALKTLEKTGLALISKVPEDVYTKLSAQLRLERYMVETASTWDNHFGIDQRTQIQRDYSSDWDHLCRDIGYTYR